MKLWQKFTHSFKILVKQFFKFYENLANLFVNLRDFIYNKNMKRLFLLILSFMFLGGAVSGSAFYISNSINAVDTQTSGGGIAKRYFRK